MSGAVPTSRRESTVDERLAEALRGGATSIGAPSMRVGSYVVLEEGGGTALLVAGKVGAASNAPRGEARPEIAYALFDDREQPVASGRIPIGPARDGGGSFVGTLNAAPGRYRLRLAATTAKEGASRVEVTIDLRPRPVGGLEASDLVIGRIPPGATGAVPAAGAVSVRDTVSLQLELRSPPAEQGRDLRVRVEIGRENEPAPLLTLPADVALVGPGLVRALATVGPQLLPQGRYKARAVVTRGGADVGAIEAPLFVERSESPTADPSGSPMHTSGVGPAAALASAWSLVPRFVRDAIVAPKVLETFLSRLEPRAARHASVRAAIRTVRERGVAELKPDEELRRSDPLVASFLTGLALLARADLEEAAGRFRESLRADADFLPAAFYLGACYAAGGKDREAVGAWQTSLIAEEENPAVYLALVDASLRLRDIDEARNFLDEARKRWPAHADFEERALLLALLENRPSEALAMLDGQVERAAPDVLFVGMQLLHAAHVARQPW